MPMWKYFLSTRLSPSQRCVERGIFLQRRHRRLDQEHQRRDLDVLVLLAKLLAECLHLGDVGFLELGDVRDHRPVARQVGAGNLVDPRARLQFDLAELAEIHLRPRNQLQATLGSAGAGLHASRENPLHVVPHILLANPSAPLAALDLRQVDAELAGKHAHGRAGVRQRTGQQGIRIQQARAGRSSGHGDRSRCRRHRGNGRSRSRCSRSRRRAYGSHRRRSRRSGCGSLGGRACCARRCPGRLDHRHQRTGRDLIADLDQDFANRSGERGRHLHRRLVRLQRNQPLVLVDHVADLHQQLDHRHA